jgi:predicted membrane-bound spermidine synthase
VINADAAIWLQNTAEMFDAAIVDFPDPSSFALGKLYSVPFYGMVKKHVAANGLVVVQSTSPFFAPHAYWTIDATLREVGMRTIRITPTCPRSASGASSWPRRSRTTRRRPATGCRCAT